MRASIFASLLIAAAGWHASRPQPAAACGGLFCNTAQPVNQAAERIIFAENGDGTVTAAIEIRYQGPADRFSWLLPVPGTPKLAVSSTTALDRLQAATNPVYRLQTRFESGCGFADGGVGRGAQDAATSSGDDAGEAEEPPVIVLARGSVGPFDYTVIRVDPQLEDRADVAIEWLEEEGYDIPPQTGEVLEPYLDEDLNLLAIKLSKDNDAGAIRPIKITYESSRPFIPIRPTAVAANDDMGVLVWVVGGSRAIPDSYKALELNEALINWFNPMGSYNDVVSAAANEAGGHGFVTEYAQASSELDGVVVQDFEEQAWQRIAENDYPSAIDLVVDAASAFGRWDGFQDALTATLTLPDGVTLAQFTACPSCYADREGLSLDVDAFRTELLEKVYEPMTATQELLLSRPYATRLYTTLSAGEMTVDPVFDFNPDLRDVSNVHMAEQFVRCDGSFQVTLPQGGMVYGEQRGTWPYSLGGDQPATYRILQLSTSGEGRVMVDNADEISALLAAGEPPDGGASPGDGGQRNDAGDAGTSSTSSDGCDCSVPGHGAARSSRLLGALPALLVLAAFARRRRR